LLINSACYNITLSSVAGHILGACALWGWNNYAETCRSSVCTAICIWFCASGWL